jgi:uncharacterized protein (TIGR03437 family)
MSGRAYTEHRLCIGDTARANFMPMFVAIHVCIVMLFEAIFESNRLPMLRMAVAVPVQTGLRSLAADAYDRVVSRPNPGETAQEKARKGMNSTGFPETCEAAVRRRYASGTTGSTLLIALLCSAAWSPAPAQIPTIGPNGLVNAATGRNAAGAPVTARGSLVTIHGGNLSSATVRAADFPLRTQLGGTQLLFGNAPAPLLYVSPGEIIAQVPFEIPDVSTVDLTVDNGTARSTPLKVTLLAQDPGIFVAIKSSGDQVTSSNPVRRGDAVTIYATGLGALIANIASGQPGPSSPRASSAVIPTVTIGGQRMTVQFAGLAPGEVVYQINATAPANLAAPSSDISIEPCAPLSIVSMLQ